FGARRTFRVGCRPDVFSSSSSSHRPTMVAATAFEKERSMRQIVWFASLALAAACSLAHAQETAGNRWPIADVAAPTTELAIELYVAIAPRVEGGESGEGVRQCL